MAQAWWHKLRLCSVKVSSARQIQKCQTTADSIRAECFFGVVVLQQQMKATEKEESRRLSSTMDWRHGLLLSQQPVII